MKFKLLGVSVKATRLTAADIADRKRRDDLAQLVLTHVPRLRQPGRVEFGELGELVKQGLSPEDIGFIVDSWPNASYITLTLLVSLAGQIHKRGVHSVQEISAWTHAIAREDESGKAVPNGLVRAELLKAGLPMNPSRAVDLWSEAAGSPSAGLLALQNGLAISEISSA